MFKLDHYSVAYGESTVINNLNFHIARNEIVALLGRNGMGKTTQMCIRDRAHTSSLSFSALPTQPLASNLALSSRIP